MGSFKELIVYKKAFALAMQVYEISKKIPDDEKYSLISQIRRSSRSVCSNLAEGFRKKQYPAHFIAKISDADMENTETSTWLDFALACKYIDDITFNSMMNINVEIGKLLYDILKYPDKYTGDNK